MRGRAYGLGAGAWDRLTKIFGTREEDSPRLKSDADAHSVSIAAWQKRFGGRPDVLGQTVTLNGIAESVIRVLPKEFHLTPTEPLKFWLTISAKENSKKQKLQILLCGKGG